MIPEVAGADRPRAAHVAVVAYTEYAGDPRVRREAEVLVDDGYVVHAITARPRVGRSPTHLNGVHLTEAPVSIHRGGKARYAYQYLLFFALSSLSLLRLCLRQRLALVHVHSLPDFQVFCAVPLKVVRVPVLLDLHEAMPEILSARFGKGTRSIWVRVARLLELLSCLFANHVVVANDGIRSALVARGIPEDRLTSVYNDGEISGSLPDPVDVRRDLGLPSKTLIVHAGGINRERDLETLFGALARLQSLTDVHLVLAGDSEPSYQRHLVDLADYLGLQDQVHFVGKLSRAKAQALMGLADVGVVTLEANALTEIAWPNRVMEYVLLRKPLVVADLPFLRQTLGDAALYYLPGDARSLADAVSVLLTSPDLRRRVIFDAAQRCDRFNAKRMRATLLGICRSLEGANVG